MKKIVGAIILVAFLIVYWVIRMKAIYSNDLTDELVFWSITGLIILFVLLLPENKDKKKSTNDIFYNMVHRTNIDVGLSGLFFIIGVIIARLIFGINPIAILGMGLALGTGFFVYSIIRDIKRQ